MIFTYALRCQLFDGLFPDLEVGEKRSNATWNAKCPIFLGNVTPKTSNYCRKNRALGFPGICKADVSDIWATSFAVKG